MTGRDPCVCAGAAERGFTLLEMLVVLGILGLMTGIAFPALQRPYRRLAADTCRFAVLADLRTARAEARRTDHAVAFAVSPDGQTYGWADQSRRLPADVRLGESGVLVFDRNGASEGARLTLFSPGRRDVLDVDADSGVASPEPAR